MPEALSFKETDKAFSVFSAASVLRPAELGFMFPTFEDRRTNIYNALYYTRSIAENYPLFVENIFGQQAPMPPKAQKTAFSGCVSSALGEECSFQVVNTVHTIVSEMIKEKKEISSMTIITCATFFRISFSMFLSFLCKKAALRRAAFG